MTPSRRGLALLVVLGILGVLAVLGTAFVTMARLERQASQQRLSACKALLLARSGLEDALARLSAGQDPNAPASRYGGENWDGSSDGLLSGWEAQQEVYRATGTGTAADVETCPVAQALRPSFFVAAGANPATLAVDGRQRGYSGLLTAGGDYSLKVEDESAKINVNGGFLDAGDRDNDGIPDHRDPFVADLTPGLPAGANGIGRGWNGQLARILGILVQQPELHLPALPTAGTDILLQRPRGGYRSIAEVQAVLGTSVDLSGWLTVSSWVDARVVHPDGYPAEAALDRALNELKKARLPLRLEEGGRPPVNLNAAARPVLVSLIQGLQGKSWFFMTPLACEIPPAMASQIADAILAFRAGREPFPGWATDPDRPVPAPAPFDTWGTFSAFCDGLVAPLPGPIHGMLNGGINGGDLAGAALLKANFDPNTHLNKQLPDELMHYWLDKSDLSAWSTEGSLSPTGGFRLTCVGRLLGGDGSLLAACSLTQTVEAFSLLRQTTQKDFAGGRANFQDYLSLSSDETFWRTTGASNPSWKTWAKPPGLAVTTYPSPPPAIAAGNAADFDGAVALATVELPDKAPLGAASPVFFLHHFDDGWDADGGAKPLDIPGPVLAGYLASDVHLQKDVSRSVWPDVPGNEPNTLCPDGFHAQNYRSPAYDTANFPSTQGNGAPFPSNHGTIGYWVKPCLQAYNAFSSTTIATNIHLSCVHPAPIGTVPPETQALMTGQNGPYCGIVMENCEFGDFVAAATVFERVESQRFGPALLRMPGLRWMLMTLHFDTDEAYGLGDDMHSDVRAFPQDMTREMPAGFNYVVPYDITVSQDLFAHAPSFVAGVCHPEPQNANQILDELAICDFGEAGSQALARSTGWADVRYQDGRYYKGNDGAFLSTVLDLGTTALPRLLSARWTEYLPRESRQEAQKLLFQWKALPRKVDPTLAGARLEVELLDAGGTLTGPRLQALRQGAGIGLPIGRFRYRVAFKPTEDWTAAERMGQPVLETPWFDDITFVWQRASGPRILAWEHP